MNALTITKEPPSLAELAARLPARTTGTPHSMTQQDGYRMIERRARQASIKTEIGNHSLRATGNTDYLKSDGSLAETQDGE
jgi:hypothetical protein